MVMYTCEQRWEVSLRSTYRRCRFWEKKIIFSVEAHFDLDHAYIEKLTHPKLVTILSGFWSRGIIGTFFFENEQGEVGLANGDRYRAMLNEFLLTKIENDIWFQ